MHYHEGCIGPDSLPLRTSSMRALLLFLLLAAPSLKAQETFTDPDFGFSMTPPPGMVSTTPEELVAASGRAIEEFQITSRADSPDGNVSHEFRWRDTTGRDRNMALLIQDGPYPFTSPDQFKEAVNVRMGVEVDNEQSLTPPDYKYGMRVEGIRTRSDGATIRQTDVFFPVAGDSPRFAVLRIDCLDGDWNFLWPEFDATLRSVEVPQPSTQAGGAPRQAGGRRRGGSGNAGGGAAGAGGEAVESWDSLEVTGSLVLAALLLLGLFMGGRSTSAA